MKEEYEALRANGDLEILFPRMSGNWEEDKKRFTRLWEEHQRLLNGIDIKGNTSL